MSLIIKHIEIKSPVFCIINSYNKYTRCMEAIDKQRMIRLLKLQIADLHSKYSLLIKQTGKFTELKKIKLELKNLEERLFVIEDKV